MKLLTTFSERNLSPDELKQYKESGYLHIPGLISTDEVEMISDECMTAWKSEKGEFDPNASWLENSLLVNIHHHSKAVRDYYFEGPLVGIANQTIGPNIKGATSQLTFKMRGNTKPFPWHQDNGYGELSPYNAMTCFTALEDNTEETGCLWVIPGSHKQGQINIRRSEEERDKLGEVVIDADDAKAIPMPMKAGDCLIFGCWLLHKSEGNFSKDKDRRVLFLRYADADAVEVYNDSAPRLGRLVSGATRFPEVEAFEANL
jgi:hypothetical protein